jgi:predicted P-loop ATPase
LAERDPIDFTGLADALLDRAERLVSEWLPGGRVSGGEWVCADLTGGEGRSCSVNLKTGKWADFSGDDRGNDLISLYAAIHNLNQGQAARQLIEDLGWQKSAMAVQTPARPRVPADSRPEPPPAEPDAGSGKRRSVWKPVVPVPSNAPAPDFKHFERGLPERTWEYAFEGERFGHVCRFRTSDGGKEILPHTWCVDESDGRGTMRWHWKQWDEPRPLFVPATLLSGEPGRVPVVLVEGEKCAQAGHELLGHEFDFVSWPGGGKAWAKARWGWLMGRTVYLWPDCDGKRQRLTKDERDAGVDPNTKPLLPEAKQPGMAAMVAIGSLLAAQHGCTVYMCPVPGPGDVSDGWDIADAVEQGWDPERVRGFIRGAREFTPPDDAARAKARSTPSMAGAEPEEAALAWRSKLLTSAQGAIKAVRENVVLALDGIPEAKLPGVREAAGVIGFNDFTNEVVKLKRSPWGTDAGAWSEVDELLMGEWLVREHWLPSMSRGTLEEAVRMVAYRHRYHPVREYLQGLEWDGERRLVSWLRRSCLEEDEWDDADPLHRYLARAGTYYVMGMCQRALQPGCKFDYMLVLESPEQGRGKSSLFRLLGGEWFADTGLVLGDKDSFAQLQGRWVYEMSELDALSRADIKQVKQYIASQSDYFRASYDRRARDYPRQGVFGGTTNEDHYLVDPTGNRRFWPVRVTRRVDLAWVASVRDQLFAEALARLAAGKRYYPLPDEEEELFAPQQLQRMVENAIAGKVASYLHPIGTPTGPNSDGSVINEITLVDLLGKIGIGIEKLGPGKYHEKQAAAALRQLGWVGKKSSRPGRPIVYMRPKSEPRGSNESTRSTQADQPERATDDCPF